MIISLLPNMLFVHRAALFHICCRLPFSHQPRLGYRLQQHFLILLSDRSCDALSKRVHEHEKKLSKNSFNNVLIYGWTISAIIWCIKLFCCYHRRFKVVNYGWKCSRLPVRRLRSAAAACMCAVGENYYGKNIKLFFSSFIRPPVNKVCDFVFRSEKKCSSLSTSSSDQNEPWLQ